MSGRGLLAVALLVLAAPGVLAAGRWITAAPMEQGRAQLGAVAQGSEIYVAGGTSVTGPVASFDSYDPQGENWRSLPPLPEGLQHFGMAALGRSIIVSGGYSAAKPGAPSARSWSYDIGAAQWRRGADMLGARAGHVLVALNNSVYAIGGHGSGARQVYRYDVASTRWSPAFAPMPAERSGHAAVALGGKIYVIGGQGPDGKATANVLVLDTATGAWSEGPKLPAPLAGHTASVMGGIIHVAGGAAPPALRTSNAHYLLDPATGGWQTGPALPTPRQGLASAVVGGRWFVFGGSAGSGFFSAFTPSDAVEIYTAN